MYPCPIHRRLLHSLHRLFPRKKSPYFFSQNGWVGTMGPENLGKCMERFIPSNGWSVDHHFPKTHGHKLVVFWELNHVKNPCFPAFRQTGWLTRTTKRDDEVWVSLSFLLALIGMETDKKPWFEFGSWYIRPADLGYMPAMPTMRKSWSPLWISMVDIKHLRFAVPARCCQFTQEPDTVPPQQSWRMAWSQECWMQKWWVVSMDSTNQSGL